MNGSDTLRFLLVPDAGAARRVRRLIAERGACAGVVIGTWPELVEWARRSYLLAEAAADWEQVFAAALGALKDAFWAESYKVAPVETANAVAAALVDLLSATEPGADPGTLKLDGLAERPRRHIKDLLRLIQALGGRLPPELEGIRDLLAADRSDALRILHVTFVEGVPTLTRWQRALLEKLNGDAAAGDDPALLGVLTQVLADPGEPAPGALGVLQSRLYRPGEVKAALDTSVQWLGVRDFLQEAEVAAGMVQSMVKTEPGLRPKEIGLLLPDDFEYSVAVEDAFRLGGIALSGLPAERWRRDLGREAVFHFLYCRQKPAPAMALAVVLSSPLMPWSREQGAVLAQKVMDGDYELKPPKNASADTHAMLALLREGDTEASTLIAALRSFGALLDGGEEFVGHVSQARATADELLGVLAAAREIEWAALRRVATPKLVTSGDLPDFNLEGVTVWRESQEPWRPVKRLIVLGFAQGQYPASLGRNAVFSAEDLAAIVKCTGLPVETPAEELKQRRERFRRQLGAVSDAVTFLVPRRDATGTALTPSESLVFMQRLFTGPETADELVLELDAEDDRARARKVALAAPAAPVPPRELVVADLEFGRDLVALRVDAEGKPKPESPSSLETLMVSRLTWLLRRVEAEPLEWAPEGADPKLLGTIAHEVFEGLFAPGEALPTREEIPERVERLVEEVLKRKAPFMRAASWLVERRHFTAQSTKAALAWREVLVGLGAEVVGAEEWLAGTWSGVAVHGQTDLILGLTGNRLLVVDYKRSSSSKRLKQMQKGFDSQASLYRAMIESGGPKNSENVELARRLKAAAETGVVYFLLNDQVALSDIAPPESASIPQWRALGSDIASEALARIRQHLEEVSAGRVALNRVTDAEFFEKEAGIKPYALEVSPLTTLFMLPALEEDTP
jgi:ATP-dependent helicase/nuclease subunit B